MYEAELSFHIADGKVLATIIRISVPVITVHCTAQTLDATFHDRIAFQYTKKKQNLKKDTDYFSLGFFYLYTK